MGSTVVPAQEADWKDVGSRALDLLAKTKDLRIASRLVRALLNTDGLTGLADGLAVMRGLVENFWDGVYPKLDPEDDNDPTFRVNILMGLCDPAATIDRVRVIPIVSAIIWPFQPARYRHRFRGAAAAAGSGTACPASIDGAFTECPVPALQATLDALQSSLQSLAAIEAFVGEKVGAASGPNFSKLADVLRSAEKSSLAGSPDVEFRPAPRAMARIPMASTGTARAASRAALDSPSPAKSIAGRTFSACSTRYAATTNATNLQARSHSCCKEARGWYPRTFWISFGTWRPTAFRRLRICGARTRHKDTT